MKTRKSLLTAEIIISIVQMILIAVAVSFQIYYNSCHRHYFEICLLPSIDESAAGIFLQVDATILTLSISLVAILSAVLSDSYMGISFSDYFLNVRPSIYKQRRVILISLINLIISVVSFWLKWNYVVLILLICEILMIIMSTLSIYSIFYGRTHLKEEIQQYSYNMQIGK